MYRDYKIAGSKDKEFEIGESVLVLIPDSTNKLKARWQGPASIQARVSAYSYRILLPDGSLRTLHANKLRKFINNINHIGIIFDEERDFGDVVYAPVSSSQDIDSAEHEVRVETDLNKDKYDLLDLNHLTGIQQVQLKQVLRAHDKVFSDKPGESRTAQHKIILEEGFQPKAAFPYRIPDKLKREVDRQIEQLLADGKIRKSHSSFSHPIVCVSKPSGEVRICCDFRSTNAFTINDNYQMPRAEDLLRQVGGAKFISNLDCTAGYWQVRMNPADIEKTAFVTHKGLFEWLFMPFGLKCAGKSFQRMMDDILYDQNDYAKAYLDDVAVFDEEWDIHLKHLDSVLTAFKNDGLTIKLSKCAFAKNRVKYIGHWIGGGKIAPVTSKIQGITDMPVPTSMKLLRSFLGMASYYRDFISNFATIALPLTDMTRGKKVRHFCFAEKQLQAFEDLKLALSDCAILNTPRYDRPFIIQTDASDSAVGACLAQLDDQGRERPLGYASAKLTDVQCRWSVIERESYAVMFALDKFGHTVFASPIDLYCDHNPLVHVVANNSKSSKLTRWSLALQKFDIRVHYKKGKMNLNADCLSRLV